MSEVCIVEKKYYFHLFKFLNNTGIKILLGIYCDLESVGVLFCMLDCINFEVTFSY